MYIYKEKGLGRLISAHPSLHSETEKLYDRKLTGYEACRYVTQCTLLVIAA